MKDKKSYEEEFKDWNTPGTKEYDKVEKIKKQAIELLENNKDAIPYGHIEKHLPKNN